MINELYNQTWRKRDVREEYKLFVRDVQLKTELKKNYNLSFQMAADLAKICNCFREVRGDGNCFYTAFGFQYLSMILMKDQPNQFEEFTKKYANIKMKIFSNNFNTEDEKIQANLRTEFFKILSQLRMIKDRQKRKEAFIKQFQCYEDQKDIDCCLYGLSTIFFRNLADQVVDENNLAELLYDRENLLIWETECNNNEVVISALAKSLKIKILLVFFQNNGFELKKYEEQYVDQVILLIKPGHYNIGLYQEN
ncbi:unnamed protein product (macronuclear) [Paramecium tetraurelia]|uniref:ubiquitinyl hydrolase 1 n=1 Tax=Paramecium tetraurelia TaxID=5888 RepID=A0BR90_PARTE|nr:uncharacterized protein GSPATT00031288001 [Paramecium tetraurelia]CAK61057.1 unnamed protein product [Paramecium tetraurelia]|eukprot:XP_001428455.1 hypothetical protein (macronuclear) [Paramecium tetraurelia strain d4-2]